MTETAISVENLSKRYRIGAQLDRSGRLTESLWDLMTSSFRRKGPEAALTDFWALRDVSFEIPRGSVVGIIGSNGAGKSTLLKILSRITEPTSGLARIRGRVASLLEVGTGFHGELSGRENVFLSGAILGMRREEIRRKYDDIVAFADIGQFIDTPVKRYSSGMKVRLGFAVAAFLEPEILIIDEVLAVGDAEFQKRCLGKMSEIGESGRTIIFVSHSMSAILRLCDRAILMEHGRAVMDGPTHAVTGRYLQSAIGKSSVRTWGDSDAPGDDIARLRSIRIVPVGRATAEEIDVREPIDIEVEYFSRAPGDEHPSVGLHFYNDEGICLFASHDWADAQWSARARPAGLIRAVCRVPGNFFAEGRVTVTVSVATVNPLFNHAVERDAVAFQVVDRSAGDGVRGAYVNEWPGVLRPMLDWHVTVAGLADPSARPAMALADPGDE